MIRLKTKSEAGQLGLSQEWPTAGKGSPKHDAEEDFAKQCRLYRLPPVEREHKFALELGRHWRFDFAWPQYRLALEIEGLDVQRVWIADISGRPVRSAGYVLNVREVTSSLIVRGRHASIQGMEQDMEKYNQAAILGWHLLRVKTNWVPGGQAINYAMQLLAAKGWKNIA